MIPANTSGEQPKKTERSVCGGSDSRALSSAAKLTLNSFVTYLMVTRRGDVGRRYGISTVKNRKMSHNIRNKADAVN